MNDSTTEKKIRIYYLANRRLYFDLSTTTTITQTNTTTK
jgi:hypothetical protein